MQIQQAIRKNAVLRKQRLAYLQRFERVSETIGFFSTHFTPPVAICKEWLDCSTVFSVISVGAITICKRCRISSASMR